MNPSRNDRLFVIGKDFPGNIGFDKKNVREKRTNPPSNVHSESLVLREDRIGWIEWFVGLGPVQRLERTADTGSKIVLVVTMHIYHRSWT
jgi:hypothetical protein